jgi:hypothetical protein
MPIKLSELVSKIASIQLWFDKDDLNVEYYPNKITDELIMGWQEAQSKGEANTAEYIQSNNQAFLDLIKSWDLLEDDEINFIPLTPERMLKVPIVVKSQIMEAIMGEMQSGEVGKPKIKRR